MDALEAADSRLADVVRTRLYLTDIDAWEAVGEAHGEVFGDVRPASSTVEASSLIEPELTVAVEAEAVVGSGGELGGEWHPSVVAACPVRRPPQSSPPVRSGDHLSRRRSSPASVPTRGRR